MPTDTHASPDETPDEQLTVGQVAELLGVHVQTVRRWCDEEYLPFTRIGPHGYRRFWRSDIERIKAQHEGRPEPAAPAS